MYNVHFNNYKEDTGIIHFILLVFAGPIAKIYISVILNISYRSFHYKFLTYFLEHLTFFFHHGDHILAKKN